MELTTIIKDPKAFGGPENQGGSTPSLMLILLDNACVL
jgi:hypothetical protein